MSKIIPTAWFHPRDNYVTLDSPDREYDNLEDWVPLYMVQSKQEPLSDAEINQIIIDEQIPVKTGNTAKKFARAIEKAHGISDEK